DVAQKENARAEPVRARREAERRVHLQRREAHVDPIEIRDDVQQKQKGDQPAANLRQRGRETCGFRGRGHQGRIFSRVVLLNCAALRLVTVVSSFTWSGSIVVKLRQLLPCTRLRNPGESVLTRSGLK